MAGADYRGPAYETARLHLARIRVEGTESRGRAARHAAQVGADALRVERVSVWSFRDDEQRLVCDGVHSPTPSAAHIPTEFAVSSLPAYLEVLRSRRVLVVEDTRQDALVAPFWQSYLEPLGVTSLLDVPILRQGRVIGLVRHEHVGPPRHFEPRDLDFACSVADLMALVFEQAERLELAAALQTQALQRQENHKMLALGRLARGVAHDINGLLTIASGLSYELGHSGHPEFVERARELERVVDLGQKLTSQLLTFGTEERGEFQSANLGRVLHDLRPLLESVLKERGQLDFDIELNRTDVGADEISLQQIVLNLVQNASDALRPPGRVVVRVREPREEDGFRAGRVTLLEVEDDGRGMDESTQARAFEPYFTTKKAGHGIGLATVFGLAQRFGGGVRIHSAPGRGTRIVVALSRTLG